MNTKWTPTKVAALAVLGLLTLLGVWLFIASAFWLVREFAGEQPAPITDNGRAAFLGVIGAIVSIVSVMFGVSLTQEGDSQSKSDDEPDGTDVAVPIQWEEDAPTPENEAPLDDEESE